MALREILHRNESKLQTHHKQDQSEDKPVDQDNDNVEEIEDVIA